MASENILPETINTLTGRAIYSQIWAALPVRSLVPK